MFVLLGFTLLVGSLLGALIRRPLLRVAYNLTVLFASRPRATYVWYCWMSWRFLHEALRDYGWMK